MTNPVSVYLVSDFTLDLLGRYLVQSEDAPRCAASGAGYGQAFQALLGATAADAIDFGVVWTRAEGVISSFARALEGHGIDHAAALAEVDEFAGAVRSFARQARFVLCVAWSLPPGHRGYGPLDWRPGIGLAGLVAQMNLRLATNLADATNVFVVDAARWFQAVGPTAAAPRMWHAGKVPYANAVFKAAAVDIKAAMRAALGQSRKLLVLDLDNTLWGGTVGETGWQGVRLGGHDHVGEAFVEFQRSLKALARRGIQLAIASKNDESVALEVFRNHPEMVLRLEDFAAWRIDWNDKAQNVLEIVNELNLGLGSAVFIDDNPAERARVSAALPEVIVPKWPGDPVLYATALHALPWFDLAALSAEDRRRGRMYVEERARRAEQSTADSVDDWLKSLKQEVIFRRLFDRDLARAAQLMNKTNQLNLSTRRLSEAELMAWAARPGTRLWTVRVQDRFGDSGLTGIVSVELAGAEANLADFVLSCRVMGRRVEEAMIFAAARFARQAGASRLRARYLPTERNGPTLMVLRQSGLAELRDSEFAWDCGTEYPAPDGVTLLGLDEVAPQPGE
jgi:FkbH-like protein